MTFYIDSHCHLNHERIASAGDPAAIIANANAAGIKGMTTIGCHLKDEPAALKAIAHAHTNVWYTIGSHPHEASDEAEKAYSIDDIIALSHDDKVIGIGESGLDYFYDFADKADQEAGFRKHIRACIATGLPLVVHTRDAEADTMRILKDEAQGAPLKGVMHCFSSGPKLAEEALDFGFYISFSGILTFKNAGELRDIAKSVPLDRLLLETDAPYLAPEPVRKKTNEPALMVHTAKCLADLKGLSVDDMAALSVKNFFTLFDKAAKTWVA